MRSTSPARGPGPAPVVVVSVGAVLFTGAYAWAQVPGAPYLALGLVMLVGLVSALAGLVLLWARAGAGGRW